MSKSMFKAVLPLCNTSRLRDEWYKRVVNNKYMSRCKAAKLLQKAYPAASVSRKDNNPNERNYTFGDRVNSRKKNSPLSVIIRLIIMFLGLLISIVFVDKFLYYRFFFTNFNNFSNE